MDIQTDGTAEGTILYTYDPNSAAAGIFIAAFGIAGVCHFVGMVWLRAAYFIPLIIGCIMEAFGYYGRFWSSRSPHDFGAFCLQSFMLVLAPLFLSATVYMALSRMLVLLEDEEGPDANKNKKEENRSKKKKRSCCFRCCCCCCLSIRSRRGRAHGWLSPLFVLSDVACFLTQLAGLGMQATTSLSLRRTGRTVLTVGLVLQCVVTAVFGILVLRYAARLSNRNRSTDDNVMPPRWRRYLYALAGVAALLLLRNIVRVAEYAQGLGGFVSGHEAFVYTCDAAPVLALTLVMACWHPGRLARLVRRSTSLARRYSGERVGEVVRDGHGGSAVAMMTMTEEREEGVAGGRVAMEK